jgi:transposase
LANDLTLIIEQLSGYQPSLEGIVVESTYNWYWLVDGLMEKGYKSASGQHGGHPTIQWAQIHRRRFGRALTGASASVGVLPQGYIYPREQRPVRDLLRKRSQLVRQRTTNLLSIQNLYTRNTGQALSANRIK